MFGDRRTTPTADFGDIMLLVLRQIILTRLLYSISSYSRFTPRSQWRAKVKTSQSLSNVSQKTLQMARLSSLEMQVADDEELTIALANYVPDTVEERHLVRNIDFTLLPCLCWMYVLACLDRGNIVSLLVNRDRRTATDVSRRMQMQLV